jgi:hypothetical protein
VQHEAARRVSLYHVCVRTVVAAEGEAALRGAGRRGWADLAPVGLDVGGGAEPAVFKDRQHRDGPPEVVGHQDEPPGRVDAHVCGAGTAREGGVEGLQFPGGEIDGERTDRTFLLVAHLVRLIGRIQARARGVEHHATRARAHLVDIGGRHRSGITIHVK